MNFASLKGCCKEMCSVKERKLRRRTNRRHKLEVNTKDHNDDRWMVKEYSRSAAGKGVEASDLRTSHTLLSTALHLIRKILPRQDVPLIDKYFFIFDRLRAVRQDASIQCLHDHPTITTLLITIRFLIYASHVLRHEKLYDDNINNTLLNQCILTAVDIITNHYEEEEEEDDGRYDGNGENRKINTKGRGDKSLGETNKNKNIINQNNKENKSEAKTHNTGNEKEKQIIVKNTLNNGNGSVSSTTKMAVVLTEVLNYHVLNNLNTPHVVTMALRYMSIRRNINTRTTVKLWLEYNKHNYHRVMKLFHNLPLLQQCLVYQYMPSIRRDHISRLAQTFIGKNNHYSLSTLSSITHPLINPSTIPSTHPSGNTSTNTSKDTENVTRTNNRANRAALLLVSSLHGITVNGDKVLFDKKALELSDSFDDDFDGVGDGFTFVESNVIPHIVC